MLALRRLSQGCAAELASPSPAVHDSVGRLLALAAAPFSASAHLLSGSQAAELEALVAEPRDTSGSLEAHKLRKEGRTPGVLFSLPGETSMLLSFDSTSLGKLLHRVGRTGWACHVFDIQVQGGSGSGQSFRALGRQVHQAADTDLVENVTLMFCPPERVVRVDVPLAVRGEELCPGLKAGGRINWIKRTIPCLARGDGIPPSFEVDISHMEKNDKLLFTDLTLPPGVKLLEKDLRLPVLKIQKK